MSDWTSLQRSLYRSVRREVQLYLKRPSQAFRSYESEFLQDQKNWKEALPSEFKRALREASLVFIGDFHTLRQSQRLVLRLLKQKIVPKPSTIGFEVLSVSHQSLLQKWLQSPTLNNEAALKGALQLEKRFGSSWGTYRELFLECRKQKIEILALSPSSLHKKSLKGRDAFAARRLLPHISERTWVLFGEHHVARPHLPRLMKLAMGERRIMVVQQNDDQASLRHLDALKKKSTLILESRARASKSEGIRLFCVLHTPIWIKWQSFLERQVHGNIEPILVEDAVEALDPRDQILWSLKMLLKFLQDPRYPLARDQDKLLDFHVAGPDSQEIYRQLSRLKKLQRRHVERELELSRTAILTEKRTILLAELTVNSCSHAAASYLFRFLTRSKPENGFYLTALAEAVAFFLSKILNHSRRAPPWKTWQNLALNNSDRLKEARSILQSRHFSMFPPDSRNKKWLKRLAPHAGKAATSMGRILADSLFEAFLSGEFSRSRLIRVLTTPLRTEREAFEILVEFQSVGRAFELPRSHLF